MEILQFLGILLILSDLKDVGKVNRVHHWQIGLGMLIFG